MNPVCNRYSGVFFFNSETLGAHGHKDGNNRLLGIPKGRKEGGGERAEKLPVRYHVHNVDDGIDRSPNFSITLYILVTNLHMYPQDLKLKLKQKDKVFSILRPD